jgi:hypothetical protein
MRSIVRNRPSPAMVVACVALAVALGGTSFAAIKLPKNSVGSKQIINHSVKKVDLSAPLPRGPRGPAGIATVTSVLGPPAPQCAVSGGTCAAGTSVATCPTGSYVIGGGYLSTMIENIIEEARRTSPTTYTVTAVNHGRLSGAIIAQAICASGPGLVGTSSKGSAKLARGS